MVDYRVGHHDPFEVVNIENTHKSLERLSTHTPLTTTKLGERLHVLPNHTLEDEFFAVDYVLKSLDSLTVFARQLPRAYRMYLRGAQIDLYPNGAVSLTRENDDLREVWTRFPSADRSTRLYEVSVQNIKKKTPPDIYGFHFAKRQPVFV